MTTIDEIYAAINQLPARMSDKGLAKPEATLTFEANSRMFLSLNWQKRYVRNNEYDRDYKSFFGDAFEEVLQKASAFISELPDAEQAKLHHFMGQLGHLIDHAKSDGIEVDYLNPLLDTMKRLSENVITYKPA